MHNWRERGCVPDSDEDENFSIDSQTRLPDDDTERNKERGRRQESQELGEDEERAEGDGGKRSQTSVIEARHVNNEDSISDAGSAARASTQPWTLGDEIETDWTKPRLQRTVKTYGRKAIRPTAHITTDEEATTGLDRLFSSSPAQQDGEHAQNSAISSGLDHTGDQQDQGTQANPAPLANNITSADSSPFSSPGSSDSEDVPTRPSPARIVAPAIEPANGTQDLIADSNAFSNLELQGVADRRFRSRKPIQLNPYQIERETYKQSWQARGMVPVRIMGSQTEALARVRNPQEETQDAWQPDDSQASAASPASPVMSEPPSPRNVFATVIEEGQGEDEFPDVDRLMQRNVSGRMQSTFKRRKLNKSPSVSRPPAIDTAQADPSSATLLPEPPTPPATDSAASSADNGTVRTVKFRYPKGFKRSGLITPNVSSPGPVDSSGRLADKVQPEIVDVEEYESNSTVESRSSADDDLPDFSRVRRRIKGVLPASWLRLDSKAQKPPSPRKAHSSLQRSTSGVALPVKGVAQRRIGSSTPVSNNNQVRRDITFDSEESEQESPVRSPLPLHKKASAHDSLRQMRIDTGSAAPIDVDSDDMEDNGIDMMFPSATRPGRTTDTSKRYQRRVTDTFRSCNDTNPSKGSSGVLRENQKSSNIVSKKARNSKPKQIRKRRTPLLSVLDAAQPQINQARPVPQFVRLASRQARQRSDHGRHSPSRKVLRLATAADTEDAMTTLTSWHRGDLAQRQMSTSQRAVGSRRGRLGLVRDQPADERFDRDSDEVIEVSRNTHVRPRTASSVDSAKRSRASLVPASKPVRTLAPTLGLRRQQAPRPSAREAPRGDASSKTNRVTPGAMQGVVGSRTIFRSGQLEMEGQQFDLGGRRLPHLYKANSLQQLFSRRQNAPSLSLPLERYLKDPTPSSATGAAEVPESTTRNKLTHRPRQKPVAKRLDTETIAYRQPSEPLPVAHAPASEASTVDASRPGLQGLGPYGTKYSTDFDIHPLEVGTYFHESTFIGSGDFDSALSLQDRDLDQTAGHITISVGDCNLRWSAWNEDVANGLVQIQQISQEAFSAIKGASSDDQGLMLVQGASETVLYLLRSVIRYCSSCLSFSDSIDREQCIARFSLFIEEYANELDEARTNQELAAHTKTLILNAYLYLLCLSHQMMVISQQELVPKDLREALSERFRSLSQLCVGSVLETGCHDLRTFYEDLRHHEKRDRGIRNDQITASAVVMLHYILQQAPSNGRSFSEMACNFLVKPVTDTTNVRLLDQIWYDIFTLQPFLEIDRRGIYRPGIHLNLNNDSWSAVKTLLDHLFALYPGSLELRNPTLNDYLRSNLVRVYVLIHRWHWSTCEIALNSIYDFFAKRGLAHLIGEEPKGSPQFLEQTQTDATLEVNIREPTFHIFLKLLAVGLKSIPERYLTAKVKRIVWRYVPNHGRTYRKDEDVQRSDLDALQNHHDLLCTLVWTLPPGCRPRLDSVHDLVDFHASHQEACRINVNAWKNLARIVISRSEQDDDIESLASWFREIIIAMSQQYRLARAEADKVQDMAHLRSLGQVSFDQVQTVVSKNQKNIIDTLLLAVAGMHEAIKTAKRVDVARKLLQQSQILDVFKMFDAGQKRTFGPVLQTLVVCQCYLKLDKQNVVRQESSEESQDYGSFDGLEDVVLDDATVTITRSGDMDDFLQAAVAQLLSNVFGAETPVDESLLARLVEVWTDLAARSVSNGAKSWSQYLEAHSPDSWFRLRRTDSVKKWTPFFMSKILEHDHTSFEDNKDIMLSTWFVSLVDRESMLKFQHIFTSAILNAGNDKDLTKNPPFARDRDIGLFNITLNELRAARTSLIAAILSDMRITYELARGNQAEVKRRYSEILKQAMMAMKTTYQEVSQKETATADPHVGGSYVTFVHQVISMMQQHTLDICAIDKFFIDSAAFPLPSNDPGGRKQLAFFLQTRSQAAAINNENQVLAGQISTAIKPAEHGGRLPGPTLREIFFAAILPAYLQATIEHEAGWILALPMMEAATQALAETLYHVNLNNLDDAQAEIHLFDILLHHLLLVLHSIGSPSGSHLNSRMYSIIASVFSTALPIIGLVDLAQRIHPTMPYGDRLELLFQFAIYIKSLLSTTQETHHACPVFSETVAPHNEYRADLEFTTRNLVSELSGHWRKDGNQWTVRNKRIDSGFMDESADRARAIAAVDGFTENYGAAIRNERQAGLEESGDYGHGLVDVML
ncbi:hypothetical protein MBLNU457_3205t1 [Dothideomycetes sp. NU457]